MNVLKLFLVVTAGVFGVSGALASGFNNLNLNDAVKTVRGDGSRKIAVFSDPTCPYSKRYEAELSKLDNVTVYTFVTPLGGATSASLAQDIVCSASPSSTWKNLMIDGVAPAKNNCNAGFVQRNIPLYKKVGARGTPFSILVDGRTIGGAAPASEVDKMLSFAHRFDKAGGVSTANVQQRYQQSAPAKSSSSNADAGSLFK